MVYTDDKKDFINECFIGIYDLDNKLESNKEANKTLNKSKKEMINKIAKEMECSSKEVKFAYDSFLADMRNPESQENKSEVRAFLEQESTLLKKIKRI